MPEQARYPGFAERFRAALVEAGFVQPNGKPDIVRFHLERRVGVSQKQLYAWASGAGEPFPNNIAALSRALRKSDRYLMHGDAVTLEATGTVETTAIRSEEEVLADKILREARPHIVRALRDTSGAGRRAIEQHLQGQVALLDKLLHEFRREQEAESTAQGGPASEQPPINSEGKPRTPGARGAQSRSSSRVG